jgi:hypothetical protein
MLKNYNFICNTLSATESKKRQRKARKELTDFYKGLKKVHETYEKIDDIREKIDQLHKIVEKYNNDLPSNVRTILDKATQIPDPTSEGAKSALNLLNSSISQATAMLPGSAISTTAVIAIGIAMVVAIGGGTLYYNMTDLQISNNGCPTISPTQGLFSISNINTDSSITVPLLQMQIYVDASSSNISFSAEGKSMQVQLPAGVKHITFDGQSILGKTNSIDLGSQRNHQLVISCKS